jgi:acyl-CoA reductase-like NAD-dependent aldehyde dehydrogenase
MASQAWEAIDGVPTYKLFIDEAWVRSSRNTVVDDLNPSTGKLCARVQQAGAEEVERAIASAYRARVSWGGSLVAERETVLFRAADALAARVDEIRDVLIDESGSTFGKSMFEAGHR